MCFLEIEIVIILTHTRAPGGSFGLTRYTLHMSNINALRLWLNKRLRWLTERLTHAKRKTYLFREINVKQKEISSHRWSWIADRIITWSFVYLFSVLWSFLVERHQIQLDTQKTFSLFLSATICSACQNVVCSKHTKQNNKRVALSKC